MGKKGKGKGKGDDGPKPIEEPEPDEEERELLERELLINHLKLRLGATQTRGDELESENKDLHEEVGTQRSKLEDITQYLNKEIKEKETVINELEQKVSNLEQTIENLKSDSKDEIGRLEEEKENEIQELNAKINEYEDQLKNLKEFQERKNALEEELGELKTLVQKERKKHDSRINDLERKAVQDKDKLKKEWQIKLKETRSNMMKLTDDHLKATTKRTIMENQQYYSELAYQSRQTEKLLQKNELLLSENAGFKRRIELSVQTEDELAKKCNVYQNTVKSLYSKVVKETARRKEAEKLVQKLSVNLKDHETENSTLKSAVEENEDLLETVKHNLDNKVEEIKDYLRSRNELEAFLVASLEDCRRAAEGEMAEEDEKAPLPARIVDYNAQQRQNLLQDILQKLDAEYEGGRGLQTSSTARSGSNNIYMPSLSSSRPYSSNLQFLDGVIDGNEAGDIFNVTGAPDKSAKSTVGIQTSALFTPEVEFFRQTIKGRERKWGEMAQSLPLTHRDTRTFLRKAKPQDL
ncbi:hypothetical protein HOP50_03g24900 [Chloropicon primus]|uniref:Cilia- and flagella-associated protein 157 n=1 Tax=Chloropicon primus TaxID=1764295 RepID=A0A5B8MKS4_9CHLO|nr:hypothetical protein A3770_03p24900 [Chloropicon primus]UPQ99183.1 hypothetical protein HOP50_03g24900 [Chloropicon primus]|eukprot:QDZ19972.1 hypothetical protein A3770_03p24900 [Chloropicon primus]